MSPLAIDGQSIASHESGVSRAEYRLEPRQPKIVGSPGNPLDIKDFQESQLSEICEIVEIRLDLLKDPGESPVWQHLGGLPLLFTARRGDEGGAGDLPAKRRMDLLHAVAADATWIDIEVASISEMAPLMKDMVDLGVPWIASAHDFGKLPATSVLEEGAARAKDAGAAVFKAAAWLQSPADLARLAEFQLTDHGILVATMGMGPLAPVSRLLCAQCGSVLNYGSLGNSPTAPGQWPAALLKTALRQLAPFGI